MRLKTLRKRMAARLRSVRKPAGVLKLPRPAKKKKKREMVDSREELDRLTKEFLRENDELMRALS